MVSEWPTIHELARFVITSAFSVTNPLTDLNPKLNECCALFASTENHFRLACHSSAGLSILFGYTLLCFTQGSFSLFDKRIIGLVPDKFLERN